MATSLKMSGYKLVAEIRNEVGLPPAKSTAFEVWLRSVIRKSPHRRTHSKAQILDVATKEFELSRYAAEITRMRVIATLSDRQASRVWSSCGRASS
jgi:hypothetical protein